MGFAATRIEQGSTRMVLRAALIAITYAATGHLSLLLALPPGYATPVWPPAGIALVAVVLWGWRVTPGIFLGSLLVNLNVSLGLQQPFVQALVTAVVIAVGACAQAMVGAALTRRAIGSGNPLAEGRSVPLFLLLGGPIACLVNPIWGTTALLLAGDVHGDEVFASVVTWWVGDTIGVLLFAPPLLAAFASSAVWHLRRWASLAVPLVVCLVGVVLLFWQASRAAEAAARQAFEDQARVVTTDFAASVKRAEAYTESVARAFGAIDRIDRAAFRGMVSPWLQANAALEAFEWMPLVRGADLAAFEAGARDAEVPNFRVWEPGPGGEQVRAAPRELHAPILFVEKFERQRAAVGYDLYSNPSRRAAMEAARDTGHVVGTAPVRLVLMPDEWGALLVAAAYHGVERPPVGAEGQAPAVRGYVATVVRVDELAHNAVQREPESGLVMRVTDMAASPPQVVSGHLARPAAAGFTWATSTTFGGRTWRLEVFAPASAPHSWAGWTALAAGLACTGLVAAFVLDVGARALEIERQVRERTAALAQVNDALTRSNLELQRFAYVASHDMREPLRTIACYSELLERESAACLDDTRRGWLRRIVGATRRMQELVNEILALSRMESRVEVFEAVPLAEPVRAALDDLAAGLQESGATVVVGELPTARCDRVQMVQLFQNLLSNAVKFRQPDVPLRIEVSGRITREGVEVSVADNGIGIEPKHWERIFEMFQKLHGDGRYPGHGIGLATCRRIVERHGGRIWVESVPGVGTVFRFVLPEAR